MTMSHLLRRTKKCCLKLFRKLSINTDQPAVSNNRLSNSRTTKYFKHKTKTSSSTSSSSTTTTTKRRKITSSSPKFKNKKLKSFIKEETSTTTIDEDNDTDDFVDMKRDKVKNEENIVKNNRNNKASQTYRSARRPSRHLEYKNTNCCSNGGGSNIKCDNTNNSNDNSNFFRFNKHYLKNYFNFYKLSQNNKMLTNNLSECRDKNQLNNDFYLNKMFEEDSIRFTDNKIYIDKNSLKSCCSKIQFNNHNITNNSSTNNSTNNNNNNNQIIFEKVIYDKNKKYLSHSPTLSAVPSPAQSIYDNLNNDNLFNNYQNDFFIFDSKNKSIASLYDNHHHHHHHHDNDRLESYDPWLNSITTRPSTFDPFCERNSCTLTSQSSLSISSFDNEQFNNDHQQDDRNDTQNNCSTIDPWSAFDLKTKSNSMKASRSGQNYAASSQRNIANTNNSNSNNNNNNEGNSSYYNNARDDLNNWCNNKISSSTLETWIDDEVFDNSFNEELEKRCAIFEK